MEGQLGRCGQSPPPARYISRSGWSYLLRPHPLPGWGTVGNDPVTEGGREGREEGRKGGKGGRKRGREGERDGGRGG